VAVLAILAARGVAAGQTSAALVGPDGITEWRPGGEPVLPGADGESLRVGAGTTVWWRRLGLPQVSGLAEAEATLVADEVPVALVGMLEAGGVRWLDAPWDIERAGLKQHQLAVAKRMGVLAPRSVVTNDPGRARVFYGAVGGVVAKALSSGRGIAPFVAEVPYEELGRVAMSPTLLQEPIDAFADCRVVTETGTIRGSYAAAC
jgi:hypothetical protein